MNIYLKTLFLIFSFCYVPSLLAGPGGLSGGNTQGFQKGDKIHFQQYSTWVSVLYNKSLCHDGQDYWAQIRKCAVEANDNGHCLRFQKVNVRQPLNSTRRRCERFSENRCQKWKEVPYIQKPNRIINQDSNYGRGDKIKKIVPSCF